MFVMNFLNNDFSVEYSYDHPLDSTESEAQFLKVKLLETHSKLMRELEYTKDLEEELVQEKKRQEVMARQNQELSKRLSTMSMKQQRINQDRMKQLELTLVETQKKNDLLRSDLESMRAKALQLAAINHKLQEQNIEFERSHGKLNEKLNSYTKEIKMKEISLEEFRQEAERFKVKYQKQVANNQVAERELEEFKRERMEYARRNEDLEDNLKMEKEKQGKQFNQILMLQKEAKDWKTKADFAQEESAKLKDEVYQLRARTKNEERNILAQLQRMTNDYNNLQMILKQRELDLQSARRRPLQDASRKKNTYEETKELVTKLQRQQQRQLINRSSPTKQRSSPTPTKGIRSFREEKEEYLSMIESVGTMESQMLACNLQKKKILSEIDKIDGTRVKTKDMVSRRRRLEVQLQNLERRIDSVRNQLKKMKVM